MSDDRTHGTHGGAHGGDERVRDEQISRSGEDHLPNSVPEPWSRRILIGFAVLCVITFAFDFVIEREVHHGWEEIPGFYALFGFLGVAALILASKELRRIVARSEDYYDVD